ncbi:hypothetical protein SLEP1_g17007 [Rubroshorea leprosula]|uniref:Uncharacterized protein n=1 Tax=Rubroshorea leprosula TaxID=152421 RepID=A0AAV5IYL7_9ROSI|nr:hypothetical protein SLEP1_g17007 [Rubroshorea leprosula]
MLFGDCPIGCQSVALRIDVMLMGKEKHYHIEMMDKELVDFKNIRNA